MMTEAIKLHDKVNILCDDDQVMQGVYVGDATTYDDQGDVQVHGGEVGKPRVHMIVRLDLKYEGILAKGVYDEYGAFIEWAPVDRTEPIRNILVDPARVEKAPIYVNVYEADRGYGGPEEGGWWFDTREPVHSERVSSREEAEERREELREQYPNTGKRLSVLGGEDYHIFIEYQEPEPESDYQPYS